MDAAVYNYALSQICHASPAKARQLVEKFDNLSELFELDESDLLELLHGDCKIVKSILDSSLLERSYQDLEWAKSKGVNVLLQDDEKYPVLLKECTDAPLVLFYIGNADLNAHYQISVVGTRMASSYGKEACCELISSLLGDNVLIVSGLAYGIDVCAHKAALEYGLPTVGVLPCGLDSIYPQGHREIAKRMIDKGGILTEFPPGSGVRRWHFIKRNRIIAGMSRCVVVVESRLKGGAMCTAEYANSYDRDVYAVPGRLCDTNSAGCNYLISRNMAHLCSYGTFRSDCGVSGAYGSATFDKKELFLFDDDKKEKILLSLKNNSLQDADSLCYHTGFAFDEVASLLLELEIEGKVISDRWCRYRVGKECRT